MPDLNPKTIELTQPPAKVLPEDGAAPKKKHIGAGAFIGTFGTNIFIQACMVIQGILTARLLGPVGRGEYAAVILWPNIFAALSIFGSNIALSRAAARQNKHDEIFRSAVVLSLATSLMGAVACYMAIPWLMPTSEEHLIFMARVFGLFILLDHLGLNLVAVDQGAGNFRMYNLMRSLMNPLYVSMLIMLWLLNIRSVLWFVLALLAAKLGAVLFRAWLAFRNISIIGGLHSLSSIMKQSIHFGLAGIANPLYYHIDKVVLLWLLGSRNLGLYVVALSASGIIDSVTSASGKVIFTITAQTEKSHNFEPVAKIFRISALLWIFFGMILIVILPIVLPVVYGADFQKAVNPARLLVIGMAFSGLANLLVQALQGQGRAFAGLEGRLAGLAVMTLFGVILTKGYLLSGMCVAIIAGQAIYLTVVFIITYIHYDRKLHLISLVPTSSDIKYVVFEIQKYIRSKMNTNKKVKN